MERRPPNPLRRRTPALHVRDILPVALLALACGAALREPLGCTRSVALPAPPLSIASVKDAGSSDASFAALVALGATLAAGMREIARIQSAGNKVEIAHAEGHDACFRVAFAARSEVVAKLVDGQGNVLASSGAPATDGVLGPRGPVCVRKGDVVNAVAEVAGASILWVAWESP